MNKSRRNLAGWAAIVVAIGFIPQAGAGESAAASTNSPEKVLRRSVYHERIEALEQKLQTGSLGPREEIALAELYYAVGETGKLYSACTRLSAKALGGSTNVPSAFLYRAAMVLEKAGRIPEMERMLDLCYPRIPTNAPASTYIEVARLYTTARKPDKTAKALERYLLANPGEWAVWVELSTAHYAAANTNQALFDLKNAVRLNKTAALLAIGENPYLSRLWKQADAATSAATNSTPPANRQTTDK
jgi:tetratricopeptide (TPR) repeat protein